jgi:hypothetical protein
LAGIAFWLCLAILGGVRISEKVLRQGCQMAMQNAALLANENAQFRIANNKQKKEIKAKRSYIAVGAETVNPLEEQVVS